MHIPAIDRSRTTARDRSSAGNSAPTARSASNGRRRLPLLCAAVTVAVAAGCGDGRSTDTAGSTGATETTTTAEAAESADERPAASVQVADTALGPVLVGPNGMTLYLFTADSEGSPTCEGACADLWPPVVDDAPAAGERIDETLLGTAQRADGSSQVTYAGQPLYRYAEDSEPGDVTGHGVNDVWFAVAPDGTAAEAPSSSSEGYGY